MNLSPEFKQFLNKQYGDEVPYVTSYSFVEGNYYTTNELIKKVIFNNPATIVYWKDGTKTVVKCNIECFDPEKGLAMAICKKFLGNKGNYYNTFKKFIGGKING